MNIYYRFKSLRVQTLFPAHLRNFPVFKKTENVDSYNNVRYSLESMFSVSTWMCKTKKKASTIFLPHCSFQSITRFQTFFSVNKTCRFLKTPGFRRLWTGDLESRAEVAYTQHHNENPQHLPTFSLCTIELSSALCLKEKQCWKGAVSWDCVTQMSLVIFDSFHGFFWCVEESFEKHNFAHRCHYILIAALWIPLATMVDFKYSTN